MALASRHAIVPPMGKGLWEVRTDLLRNRTVRVLICLYQDHLVALARIHQEGSCHASMT